MPPPDPSPTVSDQVVVGVSEVDGRLHATRQRIRVVDHGTGAAPSLDRLGLGVDQAEEVVAAEVATGRLVDPTVPDADTRDVTIHLHPARADEVTAVVSPPARGRDRDRMVTQPVGELADRILGVLTRDRLGIRTGTHLHGAALADGDGRTVVVLAPSGTGKSTMATHLAAGGLDLLTDEQLRVHPVPGLVSAFTRPVAVEPGGAAHLPPAFARELGATTTSTLLSAADLGRRPVVTGTPALVVLPERAAGDPPGWEPLASLDAVGALAANNLDLEAEPRAGLGALTWLVSVVPVVRVRHRSSAELASMTRTLLDDPPAASTSPPAVVEVPSTPGRARDLVTVTASDGALVLDPATLRLVRLNASGARLWTDHPVGAWPIDVSGDFRAELERLGLL